MRVSFSGVSFHFFVPASVYQEDCESSIATVVLVVKEVVMVVVVLMMVVVVVVVEIVT